MQLIYFCILLQYQTIKNNKTMKRTVINLNSNEPRPRVYTAKKEFICSETGDKINVGENYIVVFKRKVKIDVIRK